MDETKNLSETEGSQAAAEGSGGSSDETKTSPKPKARNRPLRVRVAPRAAIPPKLGVTRSSDAWVRVGSDGSILLMTMTSTDP